MRTALIGTLLVSSTLVGAGEAAAVTYCSTSGGFGACASAGLGLGHGGSGPAVGLRNLTGVAGDAGYVLAGFALYYVGTHLSFGGGGSAPGGIGLLSSESGASMSSSSTMGRGSRLAPLRSANSLGRNPRALARAGNGNGPIAYTVSIAQGYGSSELPELTTNVSESNRWSSGSSGSSGSAGSGGSAGCTGANCAPVLSTTAPEPATMALMALGLVGLAGAGFMQRRRHT